MGNHRTTKRLVVAAAAIVGVGLGAYAVDAAPFSQRAYENPAATPQDLGGGNGPTQWTLPTTCSGTCDLDLVIGAGTLTPADNGVQSDVPYWGFGVAVTGQGTPTVAPAGAPGSTIKVPQGTVLNIHVVSQAPGTGDAVDLQFPSLAGVTHTGNVYSFTADTPGTMIFQPGTNADAPRQIAMGLAGVLIVTPNDGNGVNCATCAFDAAKPFADEAVVALTDVDPAFAADPLHADLSYFGQLRDAQGGRRQVYHLINGKAFPLTDVIDVRPNDSLLLRYANVGVADRYMGLLGIPQSVLARNTSVYADAQSVVTTRLGAGETADVAVTVPDTGVAGQKYSLMDQGRELEGTTADGFGGALTFIDVWTGTVPTTTTTDPNAATTTTDPNAVTTTTDPNAVTTTAAP